MVLTTRKEMIMMSLNFEMHRDDLGLNADLDFGTLQVSGDSLYGYPPYELLVASIVGSSGGIFRKVLIEKRINFSTIKIDTRIRREEMDANKIVEIHLHFIIKGKDIEGKHIQDALVMTMKNCGMVQSVKSSIKVYESFEIQPY